MCAYFPKAKDGNSRAMKKGIKNAFNRGVSDYEKMKTITKTYTTKRELSVQEAVYLITP